MMDLLNSTALYSKNVLNVLSSTISLIFLHMPCRINHFHHLITKSHEISGLEDDDAVLMRKKQEPDPVSGEFSKSVLW